MSSYSRRPSPSPNRARARYTGNIREAVRSRELYKYYQPTTPSVPFTHQKVSSCTSFTPSSIDSFSGCGCGGDTPDEASLLMSSSDPALSSFTLLTSNLLSCKRAMISLLDQEHQYIIAESTRSLSLIPPHTHEPGDGLWLGGCERIRRSGGLCENTIALLPPDVTAGDEATMILEIPDLHNDPRFLAKEYVQEWPFIRYYAGVPLRTKNGVSIGSLCVIDDKPRPSGLSEQEKSTLVQMGETVMSHLERVRGERDMKRGRMMEIGLSKFVAGSFLQEGTGIGERRDGKLRGDDKMARRRKVEEERLLWVEKSRRREQEKRKKEMGMRELGTEAEKKLNEIKRSREEECRNRQMELAKDDYEIEEQEESFTRDFTEMHLDSFQKDHHPVMERQGSNQSNTEILPSLFPSRYSSDYDEETNLSSKGSSRSSGSVSLNIPSKPDTSLNPRGFMQGTGSNPILDPSTDYCRHNSDSSEDTATSMATTATKHTSLASMPSTSSLKQTKFIESDIHLEPSPSAPPSSPSPSSKGPSHQTQRTSDIEHSFRSTFARASSLIRESIEVDGVIFLDGDLEGHYDVDDSDDSFPTGPAHVSSDAFAEARKRAERPKHYRRRSGILGYATNTGCSGSDFSHDCSSSRRSSDVDVSMLGFDVGEVDEAFLRRLTKMWPQGHIFPYPNDNSDSEAETESDPESEYDSEYDDDDTRFRSKRNETEMFKRFLPGSRSVIFVPLYDYFGKVFAVGFAWTNNSVRVFCEDVEGNYMNAFGNSIMAEVSRLHTISADKAKGDFISSVSHELRSPLHGILASAEFLSETNLDSFQRSFVDTVESCGRTLLDTINHVLDFSKLNSLGEEWGPAGGGRGGNEPASRKRNLRRRRRRASSAKAQSGSAADDAESEADGPCADAFAAPIGVVNLIAETDLCAITEEVTEGVFAGYEFKGISTPGITESTGKGEDDNNLGGRRVVGQKDDITVIVDIDRREDGWTFLTQPGAIRRILLNLGGNAIKYTDSGWVRIRLKAEDLPSDDDEEKKALVTLIVTDSGKGISREFLKTKLFTPFSQENPLVSGTGLGMSIVRQIVGMMGGKIDVKSQVGKGTEVRVSLVLKQRKKSAEEGKKALEADEVALVRARTQGKLVAMSSFESPASDDHPQTRALNHLRASFERYVTQWFGMTVVYYPCDDLKDSGVDLVISNESLKLSEHLMEAPGAKRGWPGKEDGPPLLVLCSNAARYQMYQPQNGGGASSGAGPRSGVVDFTSKPCGPRKLAKALTFCLDHIEAVEAAKALKAPAGTHFHQPHIHPPLMLGPSFNPYPQSCPPIEEVEVISTPPQVSSVPEEEEEEEEEERGEEEGEGDNSATINVVPPSPPASVKTINFLEPSSSSVGDTEKAIRPRLNVEHRSLSGPIPIARDQKRPIETLMARTGSMPNILLGSGDGKTVGGTVGIGDRKLPMTLIVEDNPVNLMLLATYMKKRGYPFEKAINGLEALRAVENRPGGFDVILMDLQMPVMSGIESTRAIRNLELVRGVGPRSLIIALTGLAATSDQVEAFECGIDLFMVKPVSFRQLEKTLHEFGFSKGSNEWE